VIIIQSFNLKTYFPLSSSPKWAISFSIAAGGGALVAGMEGASA